MKGENMAACGLHSSQDKDFLKQKSGCSEDPAAGAEVLGWRWAAGAEQRCWVMVGVRLP